MIAGLLTACDTLSSSYEINIVSSDMSSAIFTSSDETFFEAAQRLSWGLEVYENEDYVFYRNDAGIWKYDKNSHEATCILDEINVEFFYFDGEKLYFLYVEEWEDRRIYELSLDGTRHLICSTESFSTLTSSELGLAPPVLIGTFFKHNNYFYINYYIGGILRYDPVSGETVVFHDIGWFVLMGENFYNTGHRKHARNEPDFINETDLQTGEIKQISIAENTVFFLPQVCNNENLYYIRMEDDVPTSLYIYNTSTDEHQVALETFISSGMFTVFNDVLIYENNQRQIEYLNLGEKP
jgi:hypothetical protein